jgi:hypothetical protein
MLKFNDEAMFGIGGFLVSYRQSSIFRHDPPLFPGYGDWKLCVEPHNHPIHKGVLSANIINLNPRHWLMFENNNPDAFDEFLDQVALAAKAILHDHLHNLLPVSPKRYPKYAEAEKEIGIYRSTWKTRIGANGKKLRGYSERHYETYCQALHASMLMNTTSLAPLRKQFETSIDQGFKMVDELLQEAATTNSEASIHDTAVEFFRLFAWMCWHCPGMKLPEIKTGASSISPRRSIFHSWNFKREIQKAGTQVRGGYRSKKIETPSQTVLRYVQSRELAAGTARKLILSLVS